tara:strand:- start:481 stop:675 length:195 start_codon:yes stop_codon:yes gene_type:complete
MKPIHNYAARIDYNLWCDMNKIMEHDAGTTSMNSMLNEGLRVIRDMKMDNIAQQRKRRESLSNW